MARRLSPSRFALAIALLFSLTGCDFELKATGSVPLPGHHTVHFAYCSAPSSNSTPKEETPRR
ncbi:MAG TPA: hypothetical protein VGI39_09605 [Polyangiaceae bacterium]|jgi:outer membrane lipopolysaccharide assembly protein LptE/RlpB